MQKRPTYSIEAVDNALQLLQLLRDGGALRLKDAAEDLAVAGDGGTGGSPSRMRPAAMCPARQWELGRPG